MVRFFLDLHWRMLASAWPRWHSGKSEQALCILIQTKMCVNFALQYCYYRKSAFSEENLINRASFLASLFKADEAEMIHFLLQQKRVLTMGETKFQDMSQLLAENGITKQQILTNPEIYQRRYELVASRIRQVKEMGIKTINIRLINTTHRQYMTKYGRLALETEASEKYCDTIHFLSQHTALSLAEAEKVFNECQWLQNTRLSTLKEKVEILQQYDIPSEALRERVWVFAHPVQTIKSRLETLKNSGIEFRDFPHSFLIGVSIPDDKFKKFHERLLEDKLILQASNCKDKKQYLRHRLACSQTEIDHIKNVFPSLYCTSLPKLKANLDILLEECKIAPSEIVGTPRILTMSTGTLKDRIKQLNDLRLPFNCKVMVRAQQLFNNYIAEQVSSAT